MNPISNLWKHPRTSAVGVLISVATVAGVLSQHGVGLGSVGSGTAVSLAGALATALLGILARDPAKPAAQPAPASSPAPNSTGNRGPSTQSSSSSARLNAWLLIALLIPLPWMEGCNGNTVARNIVNWAPALQSAVATVDSAAALLAPADAPAFAAATAGFDAASNLLVAQANAYLADPSAGALAKLQAQVIVFQQQVSAALLSAARIVDPVSQRHALAALQQVATIVTTILALVQTISSKTALARMSASSSIKLTTVRPYIDPGKSAQLIASHYHEPLAAASSQVTEFESLAVNNGF